MSSDNFDNEMTQLYQQRKSQLIAPQIKLDTHEQKRPVAKLSFIGILTAAGLASFGIMAIISHFSTPVTQQKTITFQPQPIELAEQIPSTDDKKQVIVSKPLPPKPNSTTPERLAPISSDKTTDKEVITPAPLPMAEVQITALPKLSKPDVKLMPIHKELPKYSYNSLRDKQYGEVQLKYHITEKGKVTNVSVINSTVNRELTQAAKKALAKWQYAPKQNFKESYEVIFEFSAEQN